MKKKTTVLLIAGFVFSIAAIAQDGSKQKPKEAKKNEIIYHSQAEKDKSISEQENRLKINLNDPTYPKDILEKEKQALKESKKAKIKN
ncbi:MAG: hypothetical protein ACXVO9_15265 [Bacteroidia bacterium]